MKEEEEERMYAQIRRQWFILAILMNVCLAMLAACGQHSKSTITLLSTPQSSATPEQLPEFLSYIGPRQGAQVVKGALSGNVIWATLQLEEIAESGETLIVEEIQKKVEFLIDGEVLNVKIKRSPKPGTQEVDIVGNFDLSPGEHTITVRVSRTSGEVLEYSWTFTVLDGEPTVSGLPKGLQFVRPQPDSTISLRAYGEEQLVPLYQVPSFADLRGGVCVGVMSSEMMKPGENLDCADLSRKYPFVALDSISPSQYDWIEEQCAGEFIAVDENGAITSLPAAHYKCWKVRLAPGEHEATIQLHNASGEVIQYTWWFTITNN